MLKYLSDYVSEFEKELNIEIMNKTYDRPLIEYVIDAWKSLEIVENIKFLGYKWNARESEIDVNHHIFKRTKKVKKKDRYDYKFIEDTRCGLLTVTLEITVNETDPKTDEVHVRKKRINKDILIPLEDEDGMYFINGKRYYMIYQLVEKSTYTTSSSAVIKSLMPLIIKRVAISKEDVDGVQYTLPVYNTFVFHRELPILLFVAANYGIEYGLGLLRVDNIIKMIPNIQNRNDDCVYFQISAKCYLEVRKSLFKEHSYVQSVVGGLLSILTNRFGLDQLHDTVNFVKKLSPANKYEKGQDTLVSFNRMLDETTRKVLKLDKYNTEDVYAILRWAMMNFNDLRAKDNMSLDNKRLRCNEVISSLLTYEFSTRLNRVISLGSKATMENILEIFKFPGNILIQKMHSSGVLRFDEIINDMTFFAKFKWSSKGPHSLGGKNSNNIGVKYRNIHPSFLGKIDLLVCGNSDPGTSGVLSPFCKMDGLYFNNDPEPDGFVFTFMDEIKTIMNDEGKEYVEIEFDSPDEYYSVMNHVNEFYKHNISCYGVSKDAPTIIFTREDDLKAEHEIATGDEIENA